ncbi:MAG: YkgJ family cysteine cluster protein [Candidatus Omnitrophota bacterium]
MSIKKQKKAKKVIIDCMECKSQSDCCRFGAWIDLEEAKKVISLGIKGDFFHLEKDKDFSSGYKVGTSYEDEKCGFLDSDGLCRIHKVDYTFKPETCKEFPYENNRIAPIAKVLCTLHKSRLKKNKSKRNKK